MFNVGDHVIADFGDGPVVAHVAKTKHGAEDKYGIQAPDGTVHDLTHREPSDRDSNGAGGTFWTIPAS